MERYTDFSDDNLDLYIERFGETKIPQYKRDSDGKVKPGYSKVRLKPAFRGRSLNHVLEDDGKVYDFRVVFFDDQGNLMPEPKLLCSKPIPELSPTISIGLAARLFGQYQIFCMCVAQRVELINNIRWQLWRYANDDKTMKPKTPVSTMLQPADDHYQIVSSGAEKSELFEGSERHTHKRRRVLRPRLDPQEAERLEAKLKASAMEKKHLEDTVESLKRKLEEQEMGASKLAVDSLRMSNDMEQLKAKLEKTDDEKNLLHGKLHGLLQAFGEVKEAVKTCKPE